MSTNFGNTNSSYLFIFDDNDVSWQDRVMNNMFRYEILNSVSEIHSYANNIVCSEIAFVFDQKIIKCFLWWKLVANQANIKSNNRKKNIQKYTNRKNETRSLRWQDHIYIPIIAVHVKS